MVRTPSVLDLLTSKCASRHNGVHCFNISTSKRRQFLTLLTSECASRHNGVHFFDIWTSKSGPDLVCFVHFDLEMCFAPQRRTLFRHLNFQKWSETASFLHFWLGNVLRATTACTFSTSQLPKVVRDRQFLTLLTWKCASRHNGVHFFDISTSKSGPKLRCFVHFECFAPQRRALFRHLNFQKSSDAEVLCTFWLGNVLRATTACTFSTSQLPKVVRRWCVLYILTSKCASRHNGVQFFISHLASCLRTRRFSEPTFRASGAPNHWKKHSVSRLSYLFAHLYLLSSDSFSSHLLSSNLPLLSASSLLCFSSVHIVGSLTSKLPSTIQYIHTYIHTLHYITLHTYIHYIHTYIHSYIHTYIHTYIYIYIYTCIIYIYIYTYIYIYI